MNDGVMIAFLPAGDTSWCKQDLPHLTLVYAGKMADLAPTSFNQIAKDAITVARTTKPFSLDVIGVEVFGEGFDQVDVLRMQTTQALETARQLVATWNGSEYTQFAPHVTVGPPGSARGYLPVRIPFDRLIVTWGDEQMGFPLSSY
jgi:2'-5' RNA ligase